MRVALTLASAALAWASFEPLAWWPLGWVALAPLFFALEGASAKAGAGLGALFFLAFFAGCTPWMGNLFGWLAVGLWCFTALFGGLFGAIAAGGRHLLGVPALWVGVEWLRAEANPLRCGWFVLGLSQAPSGRMVQAADLAGGYGLSFGMALTAACLARAIGDRRALLGAAAAPLAVWLYGGWVLPRWDIPGEVTAAVVQCEFPAEEIKAYRRLTESVAGAKPRLVVWPELALPGSIERDPRLMARLKFHVQAVDAAFVIGCEGGERGAVTNQALVFGEDGRLLGRYVKRVPVPLLESYVPGKVDPVFDTPVGKLGVCICYDQDFPFVTRGLVRAGAQVLAVPTMDLAEWGGLQHRQHAANARVRAVAHRRFVVRATTSGVSQIIAPDGRVLSEIPDMEEGAGTAKVAPVSWITVNDRFGWWLGPACAAWGAGVVLWRMASWRRSRAS